MIVCIWHILSLTLIITVDGLWYIHLANILGTDKFPAEWDFLRTPLFPAFLKLAFWLLGRQAMAVIGLETCMGAMGVYLLSRRVLKLGREVEASVCLIALIAYPTLIAYEHLLLTEVGTFFFLALFVYVGTATERKTIVGACVLAVVITAGFYYRSSLLYLAPLLAILYASTTFRAAYGAAGTIRSKGLQQAIAQFLIVAILPFVFAYPWQRNPQVSIRTGQSVILFGLVKSTVLPPDDPILGAAAETYRQAIAKSRINGRLPDNGLQNGMEWSVIGPIYNDGSAARQIFFRVVRTHPKQYLRGVLRNLLLYSGFTRISDENERFRTAAFSSVPTFESAPGFPPPGNEFRRYTAPSAISRALTFLSPIYDWLIKLGFIATLVAVVLGLWHWNTAILTFTAVPLAFILLHALLLMSENRMVLPTYPLLLLNLIMLPAWIRLRHAQST